MTNIRYAPSAPQRGATSISDGIFGTKNGVEQLTNTLQTVLAVSLQLWTAVLC